LNFKSVFLKVSISLLTMLIASDGFALNIRPKDPTKSKDCSTKVPIRRPYEDLIQKVAVYGEDGRRYTDDPMTRATMRLYCKIKNKKGVIEELPSTAAHLIGDGRQVRLSTHVVTDRVRSSPGYCKKFFTDLKNCFVKDMGDVTKNYELDLTRIQGAPFCSSKIEDYQDDPLVIGLKEVPKDIEPYQEGRGSDLQVGDKLTVVSSFALNFGGPDNYDRTERIIQTCQVTYVDKRFNLLATDCDTGNGASGSIALDSNNKAVAQLYGDLQRGQVVQSSGSKGSIDGLPFDPQNNFSVFVPVDPISK